MPTLSPVGNILNSQHLNAFFTLDCLEQLKIYLHWLWQCCVNSCLIDSGFGKDFSWNLKQSAIFVCLKPAQYIMKGLLSTRLIKYWVTYNCNCKASSRISAILVGILEGSDREKRSAGAVPRNFWLWHISASVCMSGQSALITGRLWQMVPSHALLPPSPLAHDKYDN